jgi:hypothetical protein
MIEELRRKVRELQQPKPTLDELSTGGALHKELEISMLRQAVRSQQLSIVQAQSAMSSYVVRVAAAALAMAHISLKCQVLVDAFRARRSAFHTR